jgi:hypothetical protein
MLDSLARLEADMHQHVHKENNVLFPKAIEREQSECGPQRPRPHLPVAEENGFYGKSRS